MYSLFFTSLVRTFYLPPYLIWTLARFFLPGNACQGRQDAKTR